VLAPLKSYDSVFPSTIPGQSYRVGIGLHDSSASLIPYLANFQEPFVLISTGTWCISMNPFNHTPLTADELDQDCLCYLHYQGAPVKASRLFAGQEHEDQVKRIADYFQTDPVRYRSINYNADLVAGLKKEKSLQHNWDSKKLIGESLFATRDLAFFENDEEAYHQLVMDIMERQLASTQLILNNSTIKRIFVDGGFSGNSIYMNLLALAFPGLEVFAASVAQATALGAALAIHKNWNHLSLPNDLIKLRFYSVTQDIIL
jgi:sugar (pentulose or hexulose) kinase